MRRRPGRCVRPGGRGARWTCRSPVQPGLSLADAYRIQDQMTALRLADGERLAGWKLGYTSAVMRAQMGIEAPNFGPLTDAMLLGSPAVLPAGALQPRVEPEIGLRLGRRLAGAVLGFRCARRVRRGAGLPGDRGFGLVGLPVHAGGQHRGRLVGRVGGGGAGAAGLETWRRCRWRCRWTGRWSSAVPAPRRAGIRLRGVAWLAEQLAGRGQALEPGDLVITGGLTSAHPLEPGHSISASFGDGRWLAEVRRAG